MDNFRDEDFEETGLDEIRPSERLPIPQGWVVWLKSITDQRQKIIQEQTSHESN